MMSIEDSLGRIGVSAAYLRQLNRRPEFELVVTVQYGAHSLQIPVKFPYVKGATLDVGYYTQSVLQVVEGSVKVKPVEPTSGAT
jgi:hypothetical protein